MAGTPFDATLKDMVEWGPADWQILSGQSPAPTRLIDADIATVSGAADKVLRVEAAPPYLLHLEFLAGHDTADQPRSLHKRNLLLEDRHDLDVRTLAVVLRPEADSPRLNGFRSRSHAGETEPYTTFRYQVLRVWQTPAATFLAGGLGTLPLAPIAAVTQAELPGIIRQMEERLGSLGEDAQTQTFWTATYIVMGLRYPREVVDELFRGVTSMRESSTYQAILQEGREEGARAEARRVLLLTGEKRWGPPDVATRATLETIADLARLEMLITRVAETNGWRELLERPTRRRRNGRGRSSS